MIERLLERLYWRVRRRDARRRRARRGGYIDLTRPPLIFDQELGGYPSRSRRV